MSDAGDEERLEQAPLFLACTRPSMFMGVTLEAFMVNVFFTGILFIGLKSIFYMSVGVFLHVLFRQISKHDPNTFKVLFAYVETKGRCRTSGYWRAATVSPLRLRRAASISDLKKMGA
jgi:type IV secretion system protein VirB3